MLRQEVVSPVTLTTLSPSRRDSALGRGPSIARCGDATASSTSAIRSGAPSTTLIGASMLGCLFRGHALSDTCPLGCGYRRPAYISHYIALRTARKCDTSYLRTCQGHRGKGTKRNHATDYQYTHVPLPSTAATHSRRSLPGILIDGQLSHYQATDK
jgi:hypothetical protein